MMSAPPLTGDVEADVVIVGCGIAGLSAAYELMRSGRRVVAIDRRPIGAGMTGRSTAHLSFVSDDGFDDLISTRGFDIAQGWSESQAAAVNRIEELQRELGVDCDFKRVGAWLFAASEDDRFYLDREFDAARRLGLRVEREIGVPMRGEAATPSLVFADQARVNPLKYIQGLAKAILAGGGAIHTGATATKIVEADDGVRVETAGGPTLRAAHVVVATNAPINDRLAVHAKQAPYRTYAIVFRLPRGALPDALYWDTADPYHYVRLQPFDRQADAVIVGGEDHKSGEANDMEQRFTALAEWTKARLPQAAEEVARWSGQVMEPMDGVAFIGRNPGETRVYVATGDSGQGMTHGALAGLLLCDLIVTGESPWTAVYDPSRRPLSAVTELVKENLTAVKNFAGYLAPGEVSSLDALQNGQGAIVRDGLQMIAAYRDETGKLFTRSAVCTHLGCHVKWNAFEKCWDCPCHGSQFAPDGEAINGPAVSPLAEAPAREA